MLYPINPIKFLTTRLGEVDSNARLLQSLPSDDPAITRPECFLGFPAGKHSGPTTARFRIKAQAGASRFDRPPGGAGSQQQRTEFRPFVTRRRNFPAWQGARRG
jgi:hypothetical protein